MTDDPDRRAIIEKLASLPPNRIRLVTESADLAASRVKFGVIFVMAFWSVHAHRAFRALTEAVAELDPRGA